MSRALRVPLLLLAACTLIACGDDDDSGVDLGSGDAAMPHDAATDAAPDATTTPPPPPPADMQDAGHDAGEKDASEPVDVDEEDAGTPKCSERLCRKMSDECHEAHCDAKSNECVVEARANGTACGSSVGDLCTQPDTCRAGVCKPNDASEGTPCGDQSVDCHKNDACDGHGECVDNGLKKKGTACGDQTTENECNALDTCDGDGECQSNLAAVDAPCGDQGQLCRNDDKCDGQGSCIDSGAWAEGQCPQGQTGGGACLCGSTVTTTCHPSADVCTGTVCNLGNAQDGTDCGNEVPTDAECDAADSCQNGACSQNSVLSGVACGDHAAHGACDLPDLCNGSGSCDPNYASTLTTCGDAPSECEQEPLCDGAGSCDSAQPALLGTACGGGTETDCNHADTCDGFGDCQTNLAEADSACGDHSTSECTEPDTCNAAGVCLPHNMPQGTDCGDQGVLCKLDDHCNANGICADGGQTATCGISGTIYAGNSTASDVIVELLGADATTTTTDSEGNYQLTVPLSHPVSLRVRDVTGYWGVVRAIQFTADDTNYPWNFDLEPDGDIAAVAAEVDGISVNAAKGLLRAYINGDDLSGNESVTSSASSSTPIVKTPNGYVLATTIMNTVSGRMHFYNMNVGTTTLTTSVGCAFTPASESQMQVFAHSVTYVDVLCN